MAIGLRRCGAVLGLAAWLACLGTASAGTPADQPAVELMKRGLYNDAVRVLLKEIEGAPEAGLGKKFLMLGESYYMLKEYGKARPYLLKAKAGAAEPGDVLIADYRLACVAYRMGDRQAAHQLIDAFARLHRSDRRTGTLLTFKMQMLAAQGRGAEAELEALHKRLQDNIRIFGPAVGLVADNLLTDFYLTNGLEDKATQRYQSIVHGFRNTIAEYARDKRPVPAALEQAHDNAAMQLGIIHLKANRLDEAARWLENVSYDAELKQKARLLLAQVAYQKRDFDRAVWWLTRDGFMDTVPPGPMRSDMYLLLGLAEKGRPSPDLNRAVEYLSKVEGGTRGHLQARMALGDLYREKGLWDRAIEAYEGVVASPLYEMGASFHLGKLYLEKAAFEKDPGKQKDLYRKAAGHFRQLVTRYPTSQMARQAKEPIELLVAKGIDVGLAASDEEMARQWAKTVRDRPGTPEAARALVSLARFHARALLDEKGERFLAAPNYLVCAAVCDKVLDEKVYTGQGIPADTWRDLRVEALYYRALSHLASYKPSKDAGGPIRPTLVRSPSLERAIGDLALARDLVDTTRSRDLVKNIDIGLLEALFKSDKKEDRERAEARFAELVNEYGTDLRFQRLAMDLAEWYRDQERYAEAAREYRGIAERGAGLPQEDRLKALYLAGRLYSKAAEDAKVKPTETRYGIYLYQKEIFQLPDLLKTYEPLRRTVTVRWPPKAKSLTGEEALRAVSEASGIPFVWSPRGGDTIAQYLRQKHVRFESLRGTVAEFLTQVLDPGRHQLLFDIGITGGKPTGELKPAEDEDPESADSLRTIEVLDVKRWAERYEPLARDYGAWRSVHGGTAMLFNVFERLEQISQTKVLWADGVPKGDVLAAEYREVPGLGPDRGAPCAVVLAKLIEPLDLRYKIVPRDFSAELYEQAKDCFNEVRKLSPKSVWGEKSLFLLALNYYRQADYERMKIVLREYLKVFDSASYEHYHEACFWVGWTFEHDKRFREACRFYNRAAEERLVLYRLAADEPRPTRDQLKARFGYDSRLAVSEPVSGAMEEFRLETQFADWVRLATNLAVRLDPSAVGIEAPINRAAFEQVPVFDILGDVLDGLGLAFRVENVNPDVAERALYRLAVAYKKDDWMPQALASLNVLLDRYPATSRKRDIYKLKLDIYKGLKDYRNVLATLERMKTEMKGEIEPYQIDFEMAWVLFDLCRYEEAAAQFKQALAAAKDPHDRLSIQDGLARVLFRKGDLAQAHAHFKELAGSEPDPLRAYVDGLMVWYLDIATGQTAVVELPEPVRILLYEYEQRLTEEQRKGLSVSALAKVTWAYYVLGLVDQKNGDLVRALEKFQAAGNSPDDWIAADAVFRAGLIHFQAKRFTQAKESFEYLLFATKSAEAEVKATYALGLVLENLGRPDQATERFDQVLKKFPDSSYAAEVLRRRAEPEKPAAQAAGAGEGAAPAADAASK